MFRKRYDLCVQPNKYRLSIACGVNTFSYAEVLSSGCNLLRVYFTKLIDGIHSSPLAGDFTITFGGVPNPPIVNPFMYANEYFFDIILTNDVLGVDPDGLITYVPGTHPIYFQDGTVIEGFINKIVVNNSVCPATVTTTEWPITTTEGFEDINYGLLYNWYAATDARNIAAAGWHVPSRAELYTLMRYVDNDGIPNNNTAGIELKDTSYWDLPNTNTNSLGFNGRGAGMRPFGFASLLRISYYHTTTERTSVPTSVHAGVLYSSVFGSPWVNILNIGDNDDYANDVSNKVLGKSIRLIKDATTLTHGQTGTYTGNDGKIYPTICIGTQEYVSCNIAETKYRNGDDIPEVTDNVAWAALITGGLCAYNNDWNNV